MQKYLIGRFWLLALSCAMVAVLRLPAWSISDAELDRASQQEAARFVQRYGVVRDPAIVGRFQAVFERVAANADSKKWRLHLTVLDADEPNAFALPNGMLFVNRGLLKLNPTDDELTFVMAHEISHVTLEHAKKEINNRQLQMAVLSVLIGGQNELVQLAAAVIQKSLEGGFSRGQESQADLNALTVMSRAGSNPAAALTFFQKLSRVEGKSGGGGMFASHPPTADRIKNVQGWIAQHPDVMSRFPTQQGGLGTSEPAPAAATAPYKVISRTESPSLRQRGLANLRIESSADGEVAIDGTPRGQLPIGLQLKAGTYTVEVRRGQKTLRFLVTLKPGDEVVIELAG